MYINIKLFEHSGLSPDDLVFLAAIKNKETDFLIERLSPSLLELYEKRGYLSNIKHKPNTHYYSSVRLSKKAQDLLISLSFEGGVDEEAERIVDWLIKVYKNKNGGIIKNKTEIKRRCQWFKTITQITGNKLGALLQCFLNDCYSKDDGLSVAEFMESNPRGVLNNMLDNVFWRPESMFDKHKTLDKSPLYIYYEDNREYIEQIWQNKNL